MARRRDPTEFLETFGALKRCLSALGAQAYASAGIGSTQAKFLRYVGRNSRISQADLARATGTDPTLTGRVLQTLLERGLVRRERSGEDRREYVLELGAAGRRAHRRVEKLRADFAARVVSVLDARDVEDFERITRKILAAFEAPGVTRSGVRRGPAAETATRRS
jgi:DNA-binding MarR family transcriptional regulator